MTYYFTGVIALGAETACADALAHEFGGVWRALEQPFAGAVLAFGADYNRIATPSVFEAGLVAASVRFPGQSFIHIDVECFGGVCVQSGFAFRGGEIFASHRDEGRGVTALEKLIEACGAPIASGHFPPFERYWFAGAGDIEAARDRTLMRCALLLAAEGMGKTGENPVVGCVIEQREDGTIEAEARTGDGGRPHAEERAIGEASGDIAGATAYVTLEPCARRTHGGTACADLLIQAGVGRVVIAASDPHPQAAGAGVARLRAAGIAVTCGLMRDEARAQNADFFARWDEG